MTFLECDLRFGRDRDADLLPTSLRQQGSIERVGALAWQSFILSCCSVHMTVHCVTVIKVK